MTFLELDAGSEPDLAAWMCRWRSWPGSEVMARPEYVKLFARPFDRSTCLVGEDEGGVILFPLILRPLGAEPWARPGEARWDATTPYGYGGPYAWGPAPPVEAFWERYRGWCAARRVVSVFARLSLFPEQLAPLPGPVEVLGPNVVVPLGAGQDALWQSYEAKVRKWVRRAELAGLEVELDRRGTRLDDFLEVYTHTMRRTGAAEWYFFSRAFFETILDALVGQVLFLHALSRGRVVSSVLVLHSRDHAYYFLGGTLEEAFALGPSYLLLHRAAAWAEAEGLGAFVLGGGYRPSDGVFRFKRSFTRRGAIPFRVMAMVADQQACTELTEDRARFEALQGATWAPRPAFFPPYRA